ncbi:Hypothetical protein POVR1_LOCUS387 [uncultured virus]|nr:Hypothetical protein POVR1_LOCUS387 [uncultured virus]
MANEARQLNSREREFTMASEAKMSNLTRGVEDSIKDYIREWLMEDSIQEIIKAKGLENDEAITMIMRGGDAKKPVPTRQTKASGETVTVEMLKAMMDDQFDDNWCEDGDHCVYFLGGRSAPRNGKTHIFCGVSGGIICKEHMKPAEGKRIHEEHKNGKFDLPAHRDDCRKKRVKYAQGKLKTAEGTTTATTLSTLTKAKSKELKNVEYELDRNLRFLEETGCLIKKVENRWIIVGVAASPTSEINKLNIKDVEALSKVEFAVDDDALSEEAKIYVNNKRATQNSSRQTFTSTRPASTPDRNSPAAPASPNAFSTRRGRPQRTDQQNNNDQAIEQVTPPVIETPPVQRMPNSIQRRSIQTTTKPSIPSDGSS